MITFHCRYCNRKIEAKDTAGGKWANCPACHNKIYVPAPIAEGEEELRIAPLDENDKKKQERLMAETFQFSQQILSEREIADEAAKEVKAELSEDQIADKITDCLRNMADGNLDEGQQIAKQIRPFSRKAIQVLDKIALSEIPEPELEGIPPQVLSGLIRKLRIQIS